MHGSRKRPKKLDEYSDDDVKNCSPGVEGLIGKVVLGAPAGYDVGAVVVVATAPVGLHRWPQVIWVLGYVPWTAPFGS